MSIGNAAAEIDIVIRLHDLARFYERLGEPAADARGKLCREAADLIAQLRKDGEEPPRAAESAPKKDVTDVAPNVVMFPGAE